MSHSFPYLPIKRLYCCFWILTLLFIDFLSGCGGPSPITTQPTLTLEIWRDSALAAEAVNISIPFTTATPAVPVTFVDSEFMKPLPHQHNVKKSDIQGIGCGCCGWHISNKLNHILEQKIDILYDTEMLPTRNLMKALVCTHEIAHYWWTDHVSGSGNVMNGSLSVNLPLYQAEVLPSFSVLQANKILKTIL